MAVDKSIAQLMQMPVSAETEVEIDEDEQLPLFETDDTIMLEDGGAIVGYEEDEEDDKGDFYANLAEEMDESTLGYLASDLVESYQDDVESRQD